MNAREERGLVIAALCRLKHEKGEWVVPSQTTGERVYTGQTPFDGFRAVNDFGKLQKGAEGAIATGMSLLEDGEGKLWVAALRSGVNKYAGEQKTNYPIKDGEATVNVFAVYKDNRGDIWLGTNNSVAHKFNGKAFAKWKP